jgi:hypothetical protein
VEKIQDRLTLIEECFSVPQNAAKPPLSNADAVRLPPQPPTAAQEKLVPSGLLREVIVETISNAAPQ